MKKIALALLVLCSAFAVFAGGINWLDNFANAKAESKKTGKPILMLFTGSDWCGYCIKMEKDAFSKPDFQKFIQSKFVMFKADFPNRIKLQPGVVTQNNELQKKYKVAGYPTVLITNAEGRVLAKTGFLRGNEKTYKAEYEKILKTIKK